MCTAKRVNHRSTALSDVEPVSFTKVIKLNSDATRAAVTLNNFYTFPTQGGGMIK